MTRRAGKDKIFPTMCRFQCSDTRWVCILAVMGVCLLPSTRRIARADALDEVRQRGRLIWGADQEGGGPYVYPDLENPDHLVGFEVDLAELIARSIGVQAEFFQADWNTLPEFLQKGTIDIILNGYEWTANRAARMLSSRPYYIYELQLMARQEDDSIQSWQDLRPRPGKPKRQVSVLGGSAAATLLHEQWADQVELFEYDGNTNAMAQVRSGVHDATLQDLPIAIFYHNLPQGRGLRFVDESVGRGYYVIYARAGEQRLIQAVNQAIEAAHQDGRLKQIYDKYGLWTPAQERLLDEIPRATGEAPPRGLDVLRRCSRTLIGAAGLTVQLSCTAMPLAIVLGLSIALGRLYGPAPLRWGLTACVEILRGTPLMLQLYVIYFLIPAYFSVPMSPITAAVLGLAVNYAAYEAEIYRAGLQAIPAGQMDAALALGMTRFTALRRIIIPQAVRIVIPPVTNDFIALFKDTSICSVIAITELTKQYNILANSTGAILELAGMTALLYMAMSYPLSLLARRMEASLKRGEPAAPA